MSKTIEQFRKERNITQKEMAQILQISISTYNMYENGKRKVPYKIACQVAKILQVEIEDIFLPCTFTVSKTKSAKTA